MSVHLVAAAQYQPVTLAELKVHCHVDADFTAEDVNMATYLAAATDACQQRICRSIMLQAWRLEVDALQGAVVLPWPTTQEIASVKHFTGSAWVEADPTTYALADGALVQSGAMTWPSGRARVEYSAGYATGTEVEQRAAVPAGIKAWVLLTAATMYANRESVQTGVTVAALPDRFVDGFLDAHKVYA